MDQSVEEVDCSVMLLCFVQIGVFVQFWPDVRDSWWHWGSEANGFVAGTRERPVFSRWLGTSSENGSQITGAIRQRFVTR